MRMAFVWDFSNNIIAFKLKAHVHVLLTEPHVLVYLLLAWELRGPSFTVFVFSSLVGTFFSFLGDLSGPVWLRASKFHTTARRDTRFGVLGRH